MTAPQITTGGRRPRGQTWSQRYDPDGSHHGGLPTYPYRLAPLGYATTRQLRTRGLRPGGQDIAAQILWRRGRRVAYLYRVDAAKPKRTATPAQRRAIDKALRARRTCPTCAEVKGYYIPRSVGECLECDEIRHMCITPGRTTPSAAMPAAIAAHECPIPTSTTGR